MVADTVPPPNVGYYAEVSQAIAKFPYDPARTDQILGQLGYTKAADGIYTSASAGRLRLEVRGVSGGAEEQDTTIVGNDLHKAGVDSYLTLLSSTDRANDNKAKGTFPGLTLNNQTLTSDLGLNKYVSANVGTPDNNWVGGNGSGWTDPEFDRLYTAWTTNLNLSESIKQLEAMLRLLNTQMAILPLYYNYQVVAHSAALEGPEPFTPDGTRHGTIYQWRWK